MMEKLSDVKSQAQGEDPQDTNEEGSRDSNFRGLVAEGRGPQPACSGCCKLYLFPFVQQLSVDHPMH